MILFSLLAIPGRQEWRDDIKTSLRAAGGLGKPTVFLLTDSQIKEESFLEDIDSLLNSGEVPNLFPPDEKQEVMEVGEGLAGRVGTCDTRILSLCSYSLAYVGDTIPSSSK